MSGVGEAPKAKEQGGLVDSVKQAGENVVKTVQQKAGGSQVGDVVQEKDAGGAQKVAKE